MIKDKTQVMGVKVFPRSMRRMIEEPGDKEVYRQTKNWLTRKWTCPKTLQPNGKWRLIRHRDMVINDKRKYDFSICKMLHLKRKALIKGSDKNIWDCQLYTVLTKPYSLYYLICRRINHDFSGAN